MSIWRAGAGLAWFDLGWAGRGDERSVGLGWAGLGWAGLGWRGAVGRSREGEGDWGKAMGTDAVVGCQYFCSSSV